MLTEKHANGARAVAIRQINDHCRQTFLGCMVMVTPTVTELPAEQRAQLLQAVRTFDTFESGSDPWREHDFGAIELFGDRWFFKFDYFDQSLRMGSDDPSDTKKTRRVLTIMHATDW